MKIEGIEYEINWKKFLVGSSFFIPCLDPTKAKKQILQKTSRLKYDVATKVTIEDGVRGVRVWRIKAPRNNALGRSALYHR